MTNQHQLDVQRILDRFEPLESSVQILCDMADEQRRQQKLSQALLLCNEGVNAARELDDGMAEAICLLHRWAIHYVSQKFTEAVEDASRSRRLFEDRGDSFAETNASIALGMSYEAQGIFLKSRGLDRKSANSLQSAVRSYDYDKAFELLSVARRRSSFGRESRKADQYQELLVELKEGYRRVLALYGQTASIPVTKPLGDLISIPVLSQPMAAGTPIPTLDDVEGFAQVIGDRVIIGNAEYRIEMLGTGHSVSLKPDAKERGYFIVPVAGDSMDRTNIDDGDYVILSRPKRGPVALSVGDIVAAVIRGEDRAATLKHFRERGGKLLLEPESSNPKHRTAEFSLADFDKQVEVAGIAVGVLKPDSIASRVLKPDSIPLASLTIQQGQKGGVKYTLSSTITLIGRDPANEIVLADPTVSLRHARIVQSDGEFVINDLGSSSGTFVNGDRIVHQTLQHGDHIVVGDAVLLFRFTHTYTVLQRFRDTWSAYLGRLDQEDPNEVRELVGRIAGQIAAALDVAVPPLVMQMQWYSVYSLDTDVTFADTLLPRHLPIVFSSQLVPRWDDIEQLRKTLTSANAEEAIPVFLLVVPAQRIEKTEFEALLSRAQSRSVDLVIAGQQDLLGLLASQDARQALRHLVLSHVRLRSGLSPYVSTGPTTDNMFFGRSTELRDVTEHAAESSFAVIGGRRIGKTSLMQRLHRIRLPGAGYYSIYHDCSLTPTLADFRRTPIREWRPFPPDAGPHSFADLFDAATIDRPLVLLLDEADKLILHDQAAHWEFFNSLRGLANMRRAQVVLSGERSLRGALRDPSSPLFNFAHELLLGPLDFDAVKELVIHPLSQLEIDLGDQPMQIVSRIYQFTSGHPNVVQRLCRRLLDVASVSSARRITSADVETIIRDPDFQREDFLYTFWEAATPLEKLVSLLMCDDPQVRSLGAVRQALSTRCNLNVKAKDVDETLQQLVDLRSLLRRTQTGYDFAVEAFPLVVAGTVTLNDQIEILVEELQEHRP